MAMVNTAQGKANACNHRCYRCACMQSFLQVGWAALMEVTDSLSFVENQKAMSGMNDQSRHSWSNQGTSSRGAPFNPIAKVGSERGSCFIL